MSPARVVAILVSAFALACSSGGDGGTDGGTGGTDGGGNNNDPCATNKPCANGTTDCVCSTNDDCSSGFRCADTQKCECGNRGTGAYNATCTGNDGCSSGACVEMVDGSGKCSKKCTASGDCSGATAHCLAIDEQHKLCWDPCNVGCEIDGTDDSCECSHHGDCNETFKCGDSANSPTGGDCVCGARAGTGAYESACDSNDDCASGSCIGISETEAFCSKPCTTDPDCTGSTRFTDCDDVGDDAWGVCIPPT